MRLDQVKSLLPKQVLEIAETIGLPSVLRLVESYGGTTWPVAKGVRRLGIIRHEALKEVIGDEAAAIMAQRWGSVALYIPKCDVALRRIRDIEINSQFEQAVREGVSANTVVAELARTYKLSDRRVWDILKQPTGNFSDDLFGVEGD